MLNPMETIGPGDTPLSPESVVIPPSRMIVALLHITTVTLLVYLLSTLFPGERS